MPEKKNIVEAYKDTFEQLIILITCEYVIIPSLCIFFVNTSPYFVMAYATLELK